MKKEVVFVQFLSTEIWIGLYLLIFSISPFVPFILKKRTLYWISRSASSGFKNRITRAKVLDVMLSILLCSVSLIIYSLIAPQVIERVPFALFSSLVVAAGSVFFTWFAFQLPFDSPSQYIRSLEYSYEKGDIKNTENSIDQLQQLAKKDDDAMTSFLLLSTMSGPLGDLVRRVGEGNESLQ